MVWLDRGLETLCQHSIGYFDKTGNVRTVDIVYFIADFAVFQAGFVDVVHDVEQALVDFFTGPRQADGVLAHFQT